MNKCQVLAACLEVSPSTRLTLRRKLIDLRVRRKGDDTDVEFAHGFCGSWHPITIEQQNVGVHFFTPLGEFKSIQDSIIELEKYLDELWYRKK